MPHHFAISKSAFLMPALILGVSACSPILRADFEGPDNRRGGLPAEFPDSAANDQVAPIPSASFVTGATVVASPFAAAPGLTNNNALQVLPRDGVGTALWFVSEGIRFSEQTTTHTVSFVLRNNLNDSVRFFLRQRQLENYGTLEVSGDRITFQPAGGEQVVWPIDTRGDDMRISFGINPTLRTVRASVQVFGGPSVSHTATLDEDEFATLNAIVMIMTTSGMLDAPGSMVIDNVVMRPSPPFSIGFGTGTSG